MKKLLSALLIATLLIASVACVFAVAEEGDTTPVIFNFLEVIEETDNDDFTIAFVDGAVEVTLKRAATADAPIFLVDAYDNAKFDLNNQTYVAIDFETTGTEADFRVHYTRNNNGEVQTADNYFSGSIANAAAQVIRSGNTYLVWDISAYTAARRLEDGHSFLDLAIMTGAEGDVITINTYALVSDADAMVVGTPLVPKAAAEDDNTSSEDEATSSEDEATSSEDEATTSSTETTTPAASSSDSPDTGDTGMIVFAVLAVVALAGGFVVVRARG